MALPTSPVTYALLKYLSANGLSSLSAARMSVRGLPTKTVNNCVQQGHVIRTAGGNLSITPKGKAKLQRHESGADKTEPVPFGQPLYRPESAADAAPAMHSSAEADAAVLAALRRASVSIQMTEIVRRTKLPMAAVRPSVTTLVQAGRIETTGRPDKNGKEAPLYRLAPPERANRSAPRTTRKWPSDERRGYRCPELHQNPGIGAERFAAFALPSRVGNRLHWPGGKVTDLQGQPLAAY